MHIDSPLYTDPLKHVSLEDERDHLGRQIAVGTALRRSPEILAYLTRMGESKLHSHTSLEHLQNADPNKLKSLMTAHAAELGLIQHIHDLVVDVEARTDRYNTVAQMITQQQEAQ